MTTVGELLVSLSGLPTGTVAEHLLAIETGGGGSDIYIGAILSADAALAASASVDAITTSADCATALAANIDMIALTADCQSALTAEV